MSIRRYLKAVTNKIASLDEVLTGSDIGANKRGLDVAIHAGGGLGDAFGRLRVSGLDTLFDSKQLNDALPLFFDDQETSGGGTSSTFNTNQASTTLAVSATTAGVRKRRTYQRFNYQPGKSQLIKLTFNLNGGVAGIKKSVGYFDDNNGIILNLDGTTANITLRTKTSGSVVDTDVAQSSWNIDKLDGTGDSGITIDFTKTHIFFIDFEWLGVGRVRCGFFLGGIPYYCHEFLNANVNTLVYMSTPNLPVSYEIENDGTGIAADMDVICSSVASEGGQENLGILRHADSGSVGTLAAGTKYAILGIRLKAAYIDITVLLQNLSFLSTSQNDQAHWEIILNPTVDGTFTYSDQTNSAIQTATGAATNTVTGGVELDGGYFATAFPATPTVPNALRLGSAIDGTVDEIVLVCRPITNNITVEASLTWRELL